MKKFPFDELGFLALQQELYQLSEEALRVESQTIKYSFTTWLPSRFELSIRQLSFLNNMDERDLVFIAEQTSFAVENRLPISLTKEEPPADGDDQGKIIYTKSNLTSSNGKTLGFVPGGDLHFKITY